MTSAAKKVFRFRSIEFYASNGCVILIDTKKAADSSVPEHEYRKVLSPGEFLKRVIAVRQSTDDRYSDEVREARRLLDEGTAVAKLAKRQGDMTDASVREYRRRHRKRSRVSTSGLILPGSVRKRKPRLVVSNDKQKVLLDGDYRIEY